MWECICTESVSTDSWNRQLRHLHLKNIFVLTFDWYLSCVHLGLFFYWFGRSFIVLHLTLSFYSQVIFLTLTISQIDTSLHRAFGEALKSWTNSCFSRALVFLRKSEHCSREIFANIYQVLLYCGVLSALKRIMNIWTVVVVLKSRSDVLVGQNRFWENIFDISRHLDVKIHTTRNMWQTFLHFRNLFYNRVNLSRLEIKWVRRFKRHIGSFAVDEDKPVSSFWILLYLVQYVEVELLN